MNPLMKNIFRKIIQKFSLMNFTTFITFFPPLYIKNFKGKSLYIKTGWKKEIIFWKKIIEYFNEVHPNIRVILFPNFCYSEQTCTSFVQILTFCYIICFILFSLYDTIYQQPLYSSFIKVIYLTDLNFFYVNIAQFQILLLL